MDLIKVTFRLLRCDILYMSRYMKWNHGRSCHTALGARTPHQRPKLPKLEHVALKSASETGAKMHQNAQICKLNFKNFRGLCPRPPYRGGATAPLPRPHPFGAPALRAYHASLGAFGAPSSPTRNPGSTPGRTHSVKILATPMETVGTEWNPPPLDRKSDILHRRAIPLKIRRVS